ncbi:C4-dicarboxylate TRAP transporter substrate-binding protein [Marispirochaeta aestuarii]|uniref:C4-dicarboxylate TRAP transporter substrate-binding protein n=1 Tax=Marispirochaeta aestuarii TaxID=1963862 RepID=UPI0029C97AAA|nr:C4-dicarboxylate TRAP transporter substrate-binding protein [Marispirochaeta aestuarii]
MKKAIIVIGLIAVLCFSVSAGGQGEPKEGEPSYMLRFGHVQTEKEEYHKAYIRWAEAVKERTNGDFVIEVYPNAQLGVEEDILEQMRKGSNVGWQTDPARLGDYVEEFSVLYGAYLLSGYDDFEGLLGSPTINSWSKKLEDEFGIKVLSYAYAQGFRNVMANVQARSPRELRGVRIRTAPAPAWLATVNSLGATATGLPYGELYNGIQTGVVDGAELPVSAARALSVEEVADYLIETRHIYQMNVLVASAEWFNSLPKEYQDILLEEADKAGLEATQALEAKAGTDMQYLLDNGMTLIPWEELDSEAFIKSGQQSYEELGVVEAKEAIYKELGK